MLEAGPEKRPREPEGVRPFEELGAGGGNGTSAARRSSTIGGDGD